MSVSEGRAQQSHTQDYRQNSDQSDGQMEGQHLVTNICRLVDLRRNGSAEKVFGAQ